MIEGTYVDPREPFITAHALERFCRRSLQPRAGVVESFRTARPIVPQCWWREGYRSYWLQPRHRVLFVVKCQQRRLHVLTCLSIDGQPPRNPRIAQAVSKWLKAHPKA